MDLYCSENQEIECSAYTDPALLEDDRVLENMLKSEDRYASRSSYFQCLQRDISPAMRKIVAEWMFEVCEHQKCQDEVFPLSMNYVDRFLSVCEIKKSQLQLLGTACLLLASKLREPIPFTAELLVYFTDNSITLGDLWSWEQLVVSKLKWELSTVTPGDFIFHILNRLRIPLKSINLKMVRRHAKTFIALCAREYKFAMYTPSIIAAACIAAALHGLMEERSSRSQQFLLDELTRITTIEQEYLEVCWKMIEEMIAEVKAVHNEAAKAATAATTSSTVSNSPQQRPLGDQTSSQDKILEHEKAGTPTDVRDVHF